ncbi:ferritin [Isachenkonia alkalipeptolytica]|uniref:Ferritin n=1 Tax=Isachenkonia alkalipeptolytica TaxID=2565777 RepID=A0AA44BF03_9CLOT|nr:ferritin [Isachenkonia alkalipeptolytica]NBG89503.1 ferritin [Isachenkonia alkalipeptolytica]
MLSEKLTNELNEQIKHEFFSANYYLAMAAYCKDQNLDGFANFFVVQAEEERFHAMKFFNFIDEMGGKVIITGYDDPRTNFDSMIDVFTAGLEHEQFVTKRIHHLMDIAMEEKNYPAISFLNWFVDEQVEEEATMTNLLEKLKLINNNPNGLFMLDKELSTRSFVAEEA